MKTLGYAPGDGWKLVSALTAKNIGGGINFMAVADSLQLNAATIGLGLTVDNILGLLYFPLISYLGAPYETPQDNNSNSVGTLNDDQNVEVTPNNVITSIAVALTIITASDAIGFKLVHVVSSSVVATLPTVLLATLIPKTLAPIVYTSETLGKALLMLFFGSIGNSAGKLSAILGSKDIVVLLLYGCMLYGGHLGVLLGVGRWLRIPMPDLLLASNANIGNGATATALASSKGWKSRLLPALLVGSLGNVIGTVLGLWLGVAVLQPLTM
jgi:uncharacterized membrane protein